jgi:hypothetical protein
MVYLFCSALKKVLKVQMPGKNDTLADQIEPAHNNHNPSHIFHKEMGSLRSKHGNGALVLAALPDEQP